MINVIIEKIDEINDFTVSPVINIEEIKKLPNITSEYANKINEIACNESIASLLISNSKKSSIISTITACRIK